jgi:hypothetical protein
MIDKCFDKTKDQAALLICFLVDHSVLNEQQTVNSNVFLKNYFKNNKPAVPARFMLLQINS